MPRRAVPDVGVLIPRAGFASMAPIRMAWDSADRSVDRTRRTVPGARPRGVQGRAAGREGPGHLHRGPASPPWAQELSARVRRLQRAYIAIDPHSELITATVVSAGNVVGAVDQRRAPADARRQLMTYGFVSSSTIRTSPTARSAGSPGP